MLNRLHIRNYALIDQLDISFGQGLNLITGETGAGKSIIMGALSLILGARAENRFLFDPGKKCVIEGFFAISAYDLGDLFREFDLDYEGESIFRRELTADGKSRAFINDTPVTLSTLRIFAERLIDIHSQHATHQLNGVDFQLSVLDIVAGLGGLKASFATKLRILKDKQQYLEKLKDEAAAAAATVDYKQFLFDELQEANLVEGEQVALEEEQQRLENAEELKILLRQSVDALQEREQNVEQQLREAVQALDKAAHVLPSLADAHSRLHSCLLEINDLASDLDREEQGMALDEERLAEVNDRLHTLYALQQKHRVDSEVALIAIQNELQESLNQTVSNTTLIEETEGDIHAIKQELQQLADELHGRRSSVVPMVQDAILGTLRQVGMAESRLEIVLTRLAPEAFRADGGETVAFLFSSNRGQGLQPVAKVASGGELSRLMLAIKSLVASHSSLPTIIFDEIDTGISGEVALQVGKVMEDLGTRMQVIAISHLPQIAAKGKNHFKVYKEISDDKTITRIMRLENEQRITEIAEMLSGAEPGDAAFNHAAELLKD